MVIGRYDCALLQHKTMPLCFEMWAENNIFKTLSNYHSPTILSAEDDVMRMKKGADNRREKFQSPVSISSNNKDYCKTSQKIDKGNYVESKFYMGGSSNLHS